MRPHLPAHLPGAPATSLLLIQGPWVNWDTLNRCCRWGGLPRASHLAIRAQGFQGNSCRPIFGDLKELGKMIDKSKSQPIDISDDIVPRVLPLFVAIIKKYGVNAMFWLGPKPAITIQDPELMREIYLKPMIFQKTQCVISRPAKD